MPSSKKTRSRSNPKHQHSSTAGRQPAVGLADLNRLEFHRHGVALVPSADEDDPAVVYMVKETPGRIGAFFCTCRAVGPATCKHLKTFSKILPVLKGKKGRPFQASAFETGPWHRFAAIMADGGRYPLETVRVADADGGTGEVIIHDRCGNPLVIYQAGGAGRDRFIERCFLDGGECVSPTRAMVLQHLAVMTLSADEGLLMEKGLKTRRQAFEGDFWCRFAYHCHREMAADGCVFHTAVDDSGRFMLSGRNRQGQDLFSLALPPLKVKPILIELTDMFSTENRPVIGALNLETIMDVRLNEALDLEIRALLHLVDESGEDRFFNREALTSFQYGDLYYFRDLDMLLQDRRPLRLPGFIDKLPLVVPRNRVPQFLVEHGKDLGRDLFRVDKTVKTLKIMTDIDRISLTPQALAHDWYWLSVIYGDGRQSVSLGAILAAKRTGERFAAVAEGWVDSQAPAFDFLDELTDAAAHDCQDHGDAVRLSRADVLRLGAAGRHLVRLEGESSKSALLKQLLDLKPATPLPPSKGLISTLRSYQQRGAEWLWFLYENRFGGLLCDDMGLGKTHQVMALMVALREGGFTADPFLVVCPTSVISHWQQKIAAHAPALNAAVYHGGGRDIGRALANADLLVTSYGILRQDVRALSEIPFAMAVFDEIQFLKNSETLAHGAARRIDAKIRIGLTGTPIENSVGELKALMDLVVPGYLGSDDAFAKRYQIPIEQYQDAAKRQQLSSLISPFILRRLKINVLHELPPKIEDFRICRLSQEQVKLYRDAVGSRGRQLVAALAREQNPVPYIHIFALLNLLKQICNHPAMVAGDADNYENYASGKWDLFAELMAECLESGQKIVIYSQYLKMIEIIKRYLTDQQVAFAALTGASRNRGRIIERFNNDPECRVFVGSLKAGGVGIDLVAASVVIHYDRWWNAAREDQATDRVHRIGQRRGVQVFKLVTQGTLEERINAIIAAKRDLMDSIVKEDDPALVKTFSRLELMEMLAMPENSAETVTG